MVIPLIGIACAAILAAEVPGGSSLLPGWAEGGLALAAIVAFFTDKVVTGRKYDQAIKERDEERARTEKAESIAKELLTDKVFPALTATQMALHTVNEQVLPLYDRMLPMFERINERLDELDRKAG